MNVFILIIIYFVPLIFSIAKIPPKVRWVTVSITFAIISSFRPEMGMDFIAYSNILDSGYSYSTLLNFFSEPLSALIIFIGQKTSLEFMLFIFAFLYAIGVFSPLLFLSKKSFIFYYSALFFLPVGFLFSFDNIRQAAAVGLVTLTMLSGKKSLSLIAITSHLSSLFALIIMYTSYFFKNKILIGMIIGFVMAIAVIYIDLFFGIIWKYEGLANHKFGGRLILLLSLLSLSSLIFLRLINKKSAAERNAPFYKYSLFSTSVLAVSGLAVIAPNMLALRFFYYFVPFALFYTVFNIEKSYLREPLRFLFLLAVFLIAVLYWSLADTHVVNSIFG